VTLAAHVGLAISSIEPARHQVQDVYVADRQTAPFSTLGAGIWWKRHLGIEVEAGFARAGWGQQANPFNSYRGPRERIIRLTTQSASVAVALTEQVTVRAGVLRSQQQGLAVVGEREAGGFVLGGSVTPFPKRYRWLQLNASAMSFAHPRAQPGLRSALMLGVRVAPWGAR
jgi:hypothetical protein